MRLLKNKTFTAGSITTAIVTLGMVGIVFTLPVFLQSVLRLDAFHTGLALLPLSLTMLVVAPLSGILTNKIPAKFIILTGLLFDIIGIIVLRYSLSVSATTATLIPGLILYGAGMGMVMAQISNLTLSSVSVREAGEASGVSNTLRQIGSSLGSAVIGAVLLSALTANMTTGIQKSTVIPEQAKSQYVELVSKQSSNVEFGGGAQLSNTISSPILKEIVSIGNQATVDSAKNSMLYAGFFILLAFIVASAFLPNKSQKHEMDGPAAGH